MLSESYHASIMYGYSNYGVIKNNYLCIRAKKAGFQHFLLSLDRRSHDIISVCLCLGHQNGLGIVRQKC
jgi:hypothetical protein